MMSISEEKHVSLAISQLVYILQCEQAFGGALSGDCEEAALKED